MQVIWQVRHSAEKLKSPKWRSRSTTNFSVPDPPMRGLKQKCLCMCAHNTSLNSTHGFVSFLSKTVGQQSYVNWCAFGKKGSFTTLHVRSASNTGDEGAMSHMWIQYYLGDLHARRYHTICVIISHVACFPDHGIDIFREARATLHPCFSEGVDSTIDQIWSNIAQLMLIHLISIDSR